MTKTLAPALDAAKQWRAVGEARKQLRHAATDLSVASIEAAHPHELHRATERVTAANDAVQDAYRAYRAAKDQEAGR